MSEENKVPQQTIEGAPKVRQVAQLLSKPELSDAARIELEIKQLELEAKKLEVAERKANVQDLEERLAEREMKRDNKRQRSITNGITLADLNRQDKLNQARCNHRKGGQGQEGIQGGRGDDSQYAVLKHMMPNGDVWVRCLRCAKTWKPPVKKEYAEEAAYLKVFNEWQAALNFQTRNVQSGSIQYRFSDGGEFFRETTASSTLR